MTNDLRYKLKKTEQENQTLLANAARLEAQVARYKTIAEESEHEADEQKSEKRKALREVCEILLLLIIYCLLFYFQLYSYVMLRLELRSSNQQIIIFRSELINLNRIEY